VLLIRTSSLSTRPVIRRLLALITLVIVVLTCIGLQQLGTRRAPAEPQPESGVHAVAARDVMPAVAADSSGVPIGWVVLGTLALGSIAVIAAARRPYGGPRYTYGDELPWW